MFFCNPLNLIFLVLIATYYLERAVFGIRGRVLIFPYWRRPVILVVLNLYLAVVLWLIASEDPIFYLLEALALLNLLGMVGLLLYTLFWRQIYIISYVPSDILIQTVETAIGRSDLHWEDTTSETSYWPWWKKPAGSNFKTWSLKSHGLDLITSSSDKSSNGGSIVIQGKGGENGIRPLMKDIYSRLRLIESAPDVSGALPALLFGLAIVAATSWMITDCIF